MTFRKITLPLLAPAMLAAALLGFALSIDDFVITYFVAGGEQTFPVFVWGIARVAVPPQVNVVASAIFLVAIAIALVTSSGSTEREATARSAPSMSVTGIDLQKAAKEHLWMHFTRMGGYATATSRSSSAATAATSRTRTASATWTRSPASSR